MFDDELLIGFVAIEGFDDVIAISPSVAKSEVFIEPVGIGVPRYIEPMSTPTLAVMRRFEQPADDPFVCLWRIVGKIRGSFFNSGRQADQIVGDSPKPHAFAGRRRRLQARLFQPGHHKSVDRRSNPRSTLD